MCRDIPEWNGCVQYEESLLTSGPNHIFLCLCVKTSLSLQTTDDIVSSAECSSDDEDLEECDSGHAGGMGVSSSACSESGLFLLIFL